MFKNTKKALKVYDKSEPKRAAEWDACKSDNDVHVCVMNDNAALMDVRKAFLEDTKNVNNWSQVRVVSLSHIRRCLAKVGAK